MMEAEWEASGDPRAMLRAAQGHNLRDAAGRLRRSDISDRKLRLFAVACCRAMDPRPRRLRAEQDSLKNEERAADENSPGSDGPYWWISSSNLATRLQATWATLPPLALRPVAALLRDIIGNPFRPVVLTRTVECDRCNGKGQRTIGSKCGSCEGTGKTKGNADWLTPTVLSLAQAAYDHRDEQTGHLDPVCLAILADALEEAGCDGCILAHLRGPGPHVRGCWAIDLLTGRE